MATQAFYRNDFRAGQSADSRHSQSSPNVLLPAIDEAAAKLLSETAHDLRAPLTGLREQAKLLRDGAVGPVNEMQFEMLNDAVGQCDALLELSDNMLHFDRIRFGCPAVRRQWLAPADLFTSVAGSLESMATPRRIAVHWEGFDSRQQTLFGDPSILRRLLINLAGNALAVSEEHSSILIQLKPSVTPGWQRLSIHDQGPGISPEALNQLAARGFSETGSTGLGLAICRALAGLQMTRLHFRCEPGSGTRVGLDLAANGPSSVADLYSRWREVITPARGSLSRHGRYDQAVARSVFKGEFILAYDGRAPRNVEHAVILSLRVAAEVRQPVADQIDQILQQTLAPHELVYRCDNRRWVIVWDGELDEAEHRINQLNLQLGKICSRSEIAWASPQLQSVGTRHDRNLLRDAFVRNSLAASARQPIIDDRHTWQIDETPNTDRSSKRLSEELQRLTLRLHRQSSRLRQQAEMLDI